MRAARGAFSFSAALLVAAGVAVLYAAWAFGPAYMEKWSVDDAVREAGNAAYLEHNDNVIRAQIVEKAQRLGRYRIEDHGQMVEVHPVNIQPDDIKIERTAIPPRVYISVEWDRTVTLPLLDQTRVLHFSVSRETDLTPVKW